MSTQDVPDIQIIRSYGADGDAFLALAERLLPVCEELRGGTKIRPRKRDKEDLVPLLADALAATVSRRPASD